MQPVWTAGHGSGAGRDPWKGGRARGEGRAGEGTATALKRTDTPPNHFQQGKIRI